MPSTPLATQSIERQKWCAKGGPTPKVSLINPSDRHKLVTKGMEIGRAYSVKDILEDKKEPEPVWIQEVGKSAGCSTGSCQSPHTSDFWDIPEYLNQMYQEAATHLSED